MEYRSFLFECQMWQSLKSANPDSVACRAMSVRWFTRLTNGLSKSWRIRRGGHSTSCITASAYIRHSARLGIANEWTIEEIVGLLDQTSKVGV
jgi:hypothetical protein